VNGYARRHKRTPNTKKLFPHKIAQNHEGNKGCFTGTEHQMFWEKECHCSRVFWLFHKGGSHSGADHKKAGSCRHKEPHPKYATEDPEKTRPGKREFAIGVSRKSRNEKGREIPTKKKKKRYTTKEQRGGQLFSTNAFVGKREWRWLGMKRLGGMILKGPNRKGEKGSVTCCKSSGGGHEKRFELKQPRSVHASKKNKNKKKNRDEKGAENGSLKRPVTSRR